MGTIDQTETLTPYFTHEFEKTDKGILAICHFNDGNTNIVQGLFFADGKAATRWVIKYRIDALLLLLRRIEKETKPNKDIDWQALETTTMQPDWFAYHAREACISLHLQTLNIAQRAHINAARLLSDQMHALWMAYCAKTAQDKAKA